MDSLESPDGVASDPLVALAERALDEHYGITGTIQPLPGEIDRNFAVTAADGRRFVLRVHADGAERGSTELQAAVLQHLEQHDGVQRLILARGGEPLPEVTDDDGARRVLRLTSWLDGAVWARAEWTSARGRHRAVASLGRLLAQLDLALADFHHPAAKRHHLWDLAYADKHALNAALITDPDKRRAVDAVLRRFTAQVEPRMRHQPRQVVHNDANDYNVLLSDDGVVCGLIDFGDTVETWRINEVAIACAYAMIGTHDPVGAVVPLVSAYHDISALTETEVELLFDLILTRYAVSISMAAKQINEQPDNTYLLISQVDVWDRLQRLLAENRRVATMRFRAACRFEAVPTRRDVELWLERNGHEFHNVLDRDLSAKHLTVMDLTPRSGDLSLDALYSDEALAAIVPIGRYGEDRSIYDAPEFETSDPGERRTIHVGIDLFAPAGEAVLAPLAGNVTAIGNDAVPLGFGGMVVLEHATGAGTPFWTVYGHLSPASLTTLSPGQRVAAGQRVGRLGTRDENGNWPAHLHFQVMTDLCGWNVEQIIGVVARSQWDVWRSVFVNPNLVLGLAADVSSVVERDADWLRRERQHVLGRSLSLAYEDPLKIVAGEGATLIDDEGRRFLDMVNNVCHVGHCHPRVVAAGQRQMARLNTNSRYLHDNVVEYSRRLTDTMPDGLSVVFMVNSGSEANDLALRLARTYTHNRDVITVDHVYHGNLTSIVDVSPYKFAGPGGTGKPDHVWVAEMPDLYRGHVRYGAPDAGPAYAASVQDRINDITLRKRAPAAFFSEAILGTGGMLTLPDGYLASAYEHVRAAGGVCIADEVQIGFGRVGSHMWAFETQGVVPDIVTLGKPIGNGHPMAAVVTTPEIADAFANGMEYFSTFGGNPVSAAIGLAVLDVIREERLLHNAAVVGDRMMAGLRRIAEHHSIIGDVRGHGLFIGVEMVRDRVTLEPAAAELRLTVEAMKNLGILLSTEGPHHNVLKIKPPIVFSTTDCDHFLATLDHLLWAIPPGAA